MGLDVSCSLVAGVDAREHCRRTKVEKEVTRFNEETGKPFGKKVTETSYQIGGMEVSAADWEEIEGRYESGELEFHRTGSEERDGGVFGLRVAGTGSHRNGSDVEEVPLPAVEAALASAREELKAYGLENEVKLFLVPYVSC